MGGKKKKGKKGKKGAAAAYLKAIAETADEAVVKESIVERITIERLAIALEELEEENKEIVGDFHKTLHDQEDNRKMDEARMQEYNKEVSKLLKDRESLKKEVQTYDLTIAELEKQN